MYDIPVTDAVVYMEPGVPPAPAGECESAVPSEDRTAAEGVASDRAVPSAGALLAARLPVLPLLIIVAP